MDDDGEVLVEAGDAQAEGHALAGEGADDLAAKGLRVAAMAFVAGDGGDGLGVCVRIGGGGGLVGGGAPAAALASAAMIAGLDEHDGDAEGLHLGGETFGEALDGVLAGDVRALEGDAEQAVNRGEVDDAPSCAARISGSTRCVIRTPPKKLVSITSRSSSREKSSHAPRVSTPAALTSAQGGPNFSRAARQNASQLASSFTSSGRR